MNIPESLFYTKEHEWAKIEGNQVTFGITDYAQSTLGDITFIELPGIGVEVAQSDTLAAVESVKAASDVYAPLSGKVIKVNQLLESSPEIINQSPYEDGWLVVIELKDESEKEKLLDHLSYKTYIEGLSRA